MSEVNRYVVNCNRLWKGGKLQTEVDVSVVLSADFDRVTAERDAALAHLADCKAKHLKSCQLAIGKSQLAKQRHAEVNALQQRLTAVDERADSFDRLYTSSLDERDQLQQRADVLEGALRELLEGTGNSPGANRKYGQARAVLAGSPKQSTPEPCQGIPGSSFQRLNALANQGE
jgi:hypothetical protein